MLTPRSSVALLLMVGSLIPFSVVKLVNPENARYYLAGTFCLSLIWLVLLIPKVTYHMGQQFVCKRFTGDRTYYIFQKTKCRKRAFSASQSPRACTAAMRDIKRKLIQPFHDKSLPKGHYKMVTHDWIYEGLAKMDGLELHNLHRSRAVYQIELTALQSPLLQGNCSQCPEQAKCPLHKRAKVKRDFFYAEFDIV